MNKLGRISVITAGLVLPLALLIGNIVGWYYKTSNPELVDITLGLAYLRPILITLFSVFATIWLISLTAGIMGLKKDTSAELSRTGLLLLTLVTVISLGTAVTSRKIADAEDRYRAEQTAKFE